MHRIARILSLGLALVVAAPALTPVAPAWADPPGGFKNKGQQKSKNRGNDGPRVSVDIDFGGHDRVLIRDYYGQVARQGWCPPGLAKKNNGCMPPGQAKKWAIGRPLPRDVIFHTLPSDLSVRLSLPPEGYRYVRVAADVLMIAVGTGMVVAAVEDLARL